MDLLDQPPALVVVAASGLIGLLVTIVLIAISRRKRNLASATQGQGQRRTRPGPLNSCRRRRRDVDGDLSQPSSLAASPPDDAAKSGPNDPLRHQIRFPAAGVLNSPRPGWPHLTHFLLPTVCCDSDHPTIQQLAHKLVPPGSTALEAAKVIRHWVRNEICYAFHDKSNTASETLAKREGMCTNKANLQVALLRAVGIPAGFGVVNVERESFADVVMPEALQLISPTTIHVFACVFDPVTLHFLPTDGTAVWFQVPEKPDGTTALLPSMATHAVHVQSNLDHLLNTKTGPKKLTGDVLERQNAKFRKMHEQRQ